MEKENEPLEQEVYSTEQIVPSHASQHSAGGSDPVTPQAIGAATVADLERKISSTGGTMTGTLEFDRGLGRAIMFKNASTTADYGLAIRDDSEDGKSIALEIRGADQKIEIKKFANDVLTHADTVATASDLEGKADHLGNLTQEIFNDATYPRPYFGTAIDLAGQPSAGQYRIIYIPYFANVEGYSVQIAVGAVTNDGLHWRKAFGPNWQKWNDAATAEDLAGKADIYLGAAGTDLFQWARDQKSSGGFYVDGKITTANHPVPGGWLWGRLDIVSQNVPLLQVTEAYSGRTFIARMDNNEWCPWREIASYEDLADVSRRLSSVESIIHLFTDVAGSYVSSRYTVEAMDALLDKVSASAISTASEEVQYLGQMATDEQLERIAQGQEYTDLELTILGVKNHV